MIRKNKFFKMSERNFGIKYGSVLGLILTIFFWVIGPEKQVPMLLEEEPSFIDLYLDNIILIGFLIYILIFFRDKFLGGFITYVKSLKLGVIISFFSALILSLNIFVYSNTLNPDVIPNDKKISEMIKVSNPNMNDSEIKKQLKIANKMLTPNGLLLQNLIGYTFSAFFYLLIISFFIKKTNPNKILNA